ncbi:phytoene desaturase [Bacillus tianshenii]|uniref:4,4'-diaponeurosporene oxygenase n=1 Tax=Sutcliffiella tianshenii TaxID=1463404 RepID=A0ABS2P141_9BACI|nr:phytoene desaturase family protein [Bacillus tianshenii]MBM7620681.1 phytoene desaturase [Bacillus tianshenii]
MKKIVVIGGGLGGLSSAISLASQGFDVTLLEKNRHLGGKLMPVTLGDAYFDFGPNTITMPDVFREVIRLSGENPDAYFEFIKLKTHTRNVSYDGKVFDFSSDQEKMKEQLSMIDPVGAKNYEAFIKEITRLFQLGNSHFFRKSFTSSMDYLSPGLGAAFTKVRPLQSLHQFFSRYFSDPFLLQALDRYATYIGSSPYISPATFALIAYLELVEGVYYTKGGNWKIAEAFEKVARITGVTIRTDCRVTSIQVKNGKAVAVLTADGDTYPCDVVVMNADLLAAYPELVEEKERPHFPDRKAASFEPSISAFVALASLNTRNKQLLHHNVFFSSDYKKEFKELFEERKYPKSPTIYISNSSVTEHEKGPSGDNLFILANAPAVNGSDTQDGFSESYKELIYETLDKRGVSINGHILQEQLITPQDIKSNFGAFKGSLYGVASNRKTDAFFRPRNKSRDVANLYFVGGSTHPGGGSPMVTLSGLNVAEAIVKRHAKK